MSPHDECAIFPCASVDASLTNGCFLLFLGHLLIDDFLLLPRRAEFLAGQPVVLLYLLLTCMKCEPSLVTMARG